MATKQTDDEELSERIVDIDVSEEMETSFLEYAYSVIYSRALPDARDGLKPVQRRILYTMDQMRIRPDVSHVKCSRVVGQVMGLYHPHGDSAIYDALVRLGQTWAMRLPTVDGHGNFGSLDSGPAAMRYTECRMAPAAVAMTADIDAETVDFRPNYDGKESEPTVLPAAFPNLLVNGSTGIAVGMATNIPPHNLIEVVQALKHLLWHPAAEVDELMRFVPGPDFPEGGKIIGLEGIRDAYHTGRGSFKVRATARIEQVHPRRKGIVVTELPYLVGPERIIEQVKNLVTAKKLTGIADIKDLTDLTNGTRLVIEIKNGINPDVLLAELYRLTKLEDSFAINNVALVDGQPQTLNLKQLLSVYLEHRLQVIRRRTAFRLGKAQDRLHLVEGLLKAILDIDDVIAIIRSSDDGSQARTRLIDAFDLTEVQANYILDMQLRRLTKFSTIELEGERDELWRAIAELQAILDSDERLREVTSTELDEVVRQHGTPRRTILLASAGNQVSAAKAAANAAANLEIPDDPCWVMLSSTGLLARSDNDEPLPTSGPRAAHDVISSAIRTTARGEFCAITNRGRLLRAEAIDIPAVPVTAAAPNLQGGAPAIELLPLESGERVLALGSLTDATFGWALGTRNGVVKRVNPEIIGKDTWDIIRLDEDDEVVGAVELAHDLVELVFISSDAQLLHFPATAVRPQGRAGAGMAGIKLAAGARVVYFGATPVQDSSVVTVAGSSTALPGTETGSVKVTPLAAFPGKGRATGGVRCQRFLKGEDGLLLGWAGPDPAIAAAANGNPVELPEPDERRDGSGLPAAQPIDAVGSRYHA